MVDFGDRVMRAPVRAEPVRARLEVGLEDGFQHQFERGLHHPVGHGRDAQLAELAARLRDHHLPYRYRLKSPGHQLGPDLAQERVHPYPGGDPRHGGVVHPGPGVRAPLFPATRSHAIVRNAGSQTRLYRSSNRRPRSAAAQPCSLVCILRTARKARASLGHPVAPVFTGASSDITVPSCFLSLPPFPMRSAFPTSEYYDGSAPTHTLRPATRLSPPRWWGTECGGFPRSLLFG